MTLHTYAVTVESLRTVETVYVKDTEEIWAKRNVEDRIVKQQTSDSPAYLVTSVSEVS